jgi:hypothetical protein
VWPVVLLALLAVGACAYQFGVAQVGQRLAELGVGGHKNGFELIDRLSLDLFAEALVIVNGLSISAGPSLACVVAAPCR